MTIIGFLMQFYRNMMRIESQSKMYASIPACTLIPLTLRKRRHLLCTSLCNIMCKVSIPDTKGSGQVFYFKEKETKYVQQQYMQYFSKL